MTKILEDILKLSVSERIILVENIWDSIAKNDDQIDLSSETKQMLDDRLKDHQLNPQTGSSWQEVKTRIKQNRNV